MTLEDAIDEAKRNAQRFPSGKDASGREWIEIKGQKYPKDWFIHHAARMMAGGELG